MRLCQTKNARFRTLTEKKIISFDPPVFPVARKSAAVY
jgi:hypothetical protein